MSRSCFLLFISQHRTQVLLSNPGCEAGLCAELLHAVCAVDSSRGTLDADSFGIGMLHWIQHCAEAVGNTEGAAKIYGDSAAVHALISTALTETIWVLNIEWEPDIASGDDHRWESERLGHLKQSRVLVAIAKGLISSGVIDQDLAKERLDADFLEQVGAIPSATAFTRKYIRLNTALNFKQTKFNLACEQNEGFSKLVVLIQGGMAFVTPQQLNSELLKRACSYSMADDSQSVVVRALRADGDLQERVALLLVDIKRLIGVFNLDPNRVVDVILDCFISNVRFYWSFFIALFDASPWCRITPEAPKLAQLVGWKLQFYAGESASAARFMDELATVTALLIAHRLIRLSDVYSMLAPARNEEMSREFDTWCAAQKEKRALGAGSRLAEMGGLEDAGESAEHKAAANVKASPPRGDWTNQHALVCAKLLAVGDTRHALMYIRRFPNLPRMHPSIADIAVRIIDVTTNSLYHSVDCVRAPVKARLRITTSMPVDVGEVGSARNEAWGLPPNTLERPQQTPESYTARKNHVLSPLISGPNVVFFYEDFWLLEAAEQLPRIQVIGDVPRALAPWLNVAFARIHRLPALLIRLMRLCRFGLLNQPDQEPVWVGFLRAWILPAFSFATPSAGLSNELWLLISMLPLAKRYNLYRDWGTILASGQLLLPHTTASESVQQYDTHSNALDMAMSLDDALEGAADDSIGGSSAGIQTSFVEVEALSFEVRRQVRSVMRRLSGDTVKLVGRQLCRLCHATPTLSLKIILDQVCSYDNLVDSVVEAFRYLTPLDADVLFYIILTTLDDPANTRTKEDGVNAAHWLQSLSLFTAAFSHRHENPMLGVVLGYVLRQIISMTRIENAPPVFETVILSDAILRLAAIDVMANATEDQIMALQGGYHLCLEAFSMVSQWVLPQDATADTVLTTSSNSRLTKRLAQWLANVVATRDQALSFVVAMCIHADKILMTTSLPLGNILIIYDREIERIHQLFYLLHTNLKPERYGRLIPGPHVLANDYGLSWGMAILWGRPSISARLMHDLRQWENQDESEQIVVTIIEQESGESGAGSGEPKPDPNRMDKADGTEQVIAEATGADSPADTKTSVGVGLPSDSANMDVDSCKDKRDDGGNTSIIKDGGNAKSNDADEAPRVVAGLHFEAPLLPREYVDYIAQSLPPAAAEVGLSPEFVAVFWTLSLYDIEVPAERYAKDIAIHTQLIKRIDVLSKKVTGGKSKTAALAQVQARAVTAVECLEKEMQTQKEHVLRIRRWLIAQKDYWFCMAHEQRKLVTQALLQHCVLPRAVLSASDANFCAKFLWMMHFPLATNKFSLMIVYDNIFGESLSTLLAAFTENEARNYAKFLNTSLAYLAPLHLSEAHYNDRAVNPWRGLTGFQQHWRYERGYLPPKSRTIRQQMPPNAVADGGDACRIKPGSVMLSFDDFRTVMRKWQVNLTKAFICTLDSERNDTVRNGILALKEMQKSFPSILQYGRRILDKVGEVASGGRSVGVNADESEDSDKNLKVMAASYSAHLAMAKKTWIPEADYYPATVKSTSAGRSTQQAPSQASTQKPIREPIGSTSGPRNPAKSDSKAVETRADGAERLHHNPSVGRSLSSGQAIAAAATPVPASTLAPASTSTATAATSGSTNVTSPNSQRQNKSGNVIHNGDTREQTQNSNGREAGRGHGREHQRSRQSDANSTRRESRSQRASPAGREHNEVHPDTHAKKRQRDELGNKKPETPRQRTGVTSSPRRRSASPAIPALQPTAVAAAAAAAAALPTAKLSNEEADQKRKELRAQLLKQQEEKQKQTRIATNNPADKRDKTSRGTSSRRGSQDVPRIRYTDSQGGNRSRPGVRETDRRPRNSDSRNSDSNSANYNANSLPDQPERVDHNPRRHSRGGRYSSVNDTSFTRGSSGRQGRQDGDTRSVSAAFLGRKGLGDRQANEGANGSGGGLRRGPKRGRTTEHHEWDEGKRHRK
ncbi:THO2 plays a role in transcriptional elongation [Coemansia sp. RSA 988]|nr:THO2 plays a role in transcriptional elongation [Coemansia sp. RSA 988]